jgi:hypothetical protein
MRYCRVLAGAGAADRARIGSRGWIRVAIASKFTSASASAIPKASARLLIVGFA